VWISTLSIAEQTFCVRYWRKKWGYNGTVHQLLIDFEKAYNLGEKYYTVF